MAREDFIQNLRLAAGALAPAVETDSPDLNAAELTRRLQRAALWLTPKSVEGFNPSDFADLPQELRGGLERAVNGFLAVAGKVPPGSPATAEQVREAWSHFRTVLEITQRVVQEEWVNAVRGLVQETAAWGRNQGWIVKEEKKRLKERFLGSYEAPLLLIHTGKAHLLLEPVARYVTAGGSGLTELCLLPSYDSLRITRARDGWYLDGGGENGTHQPLSEQTFVSAVRRLSEAA